jgi:hypothetical protein
MRQDDDESSLGDAKSSLGDAKSSLGDAKSSGDSHPAAPSSTSAVTVFASGLARRAVGHLNSWFGIIPHGQLCTDQPYGVGCAIGVCSPRRTTPTRR